MGPVPDIPLVKAQVVTSLAARFALDKTTDSFHLLNLLVNGVCHSQVIGSIVVWIAYIAMQADVICKGTNVLEYCAIPVHVRGQGDIARAARYGFNRWIRVFHQLCSLLSTNGILICRYMPELPRTIHFVPQAPELNIMRSF